MRRRAYLELGRVSNLPTVWTNVLAGVVLSGGQVSPGRLGMLVVALSAFYLGGMFLNDAFDRKWDAAVRPERPIPSGRVTAREAFAAGFALLGVGLALVAAAGGSRAAGAGAALGVAIVVYDAWHKGNPFSPLLMGLCRVLVYVTAALAASGRAGGAVAAGAAALFAYLVGLTYAAKQETLTEVKGVWPLALLAGPLVYYAARAPAGGLLALALAAALALWTVRAVSLLVRRPPFVPRAVTSLIAGISLLDGLLIALHGGGVLALGGVAGFALTLAFQRRVQGT